MRAFPLSPWERANSEGLDEELQVRRLIVCAGVLLAGAWALAAESDLGEKLARVRPKLDSARKEDRQAAYQAYLAEGDAGRQALRDALLSPRKAKLEKCHSLSLADSTQKKLLAVHKKLEEARKDALRIIFDRKIYPDENHGRVGQPVVDEAVKLVKAICPVHESGFGWVLRRVPRAELSGHPDKGQVLVIASLPGSVLRTYQGVAAAYERLVEIDTQLASCGGAEGLELKPTLAKAVGPRIQPELLEALGKFAEFFDYAARCLRYNARVQTTATDGERTIVDLTNEYRIQLGVKPLAINELLVQAARKHSREMVELKYFAHDSPRPENRSPGQRCANEGYKNCSGENIASGGGAPEAFTMWYNSSGHHRNMLNPGNNEIGIGGPSPWTEDFGARKGLDLDNPPRTRKHPETKEKK